MRQIKRGRVYGASAPPRWEWHGRPSAMDRAWLNLDNTLMNLGLMSAEGHPKLALAVPGNHPVGLYDPVTPLRPPTAVAGIDGSGAGRPSVP